MELIKKSERNIKLSACFNTYKTLGAKIENKGTYMKWKDLHTGGRMTVKLSVYRIDLVNPELNTNARWYVMGDSLDRLCFSSDKVGLSTIKEWLSEKGYQTEHDFYISDGMTEENWKAWNGSEE